MELWQEMNHYKIPKVRISTEEWEKEYANTYNILALHAPTLDLILAAQDIIRIYLLLEAKAASDDSDD